MAETSQKFNMTVHRQIKEKAQDMLLQNDFERLTFYQREDNCLSTTPLDKASMFSVSSIHRAVFNGDLNLVKRLLTDGENVNSKLNDGPKLLQSSDVSPRKWFGYFKGTTPLIIACQRGNIRMVKLLIEKGALVNMPDSLGLTPFAVACSENHIDICKCLYSHRALSDIREERLGMTPLMIACRKNYITIVKWLVSKGSNVNSRDSYGRSPLHYACWNYNSSMIELLIAKGTKINGRDKDGNTPLHLLVSLDDLEPDPFGTISSIIETQICGEVLTMINSLDGHSLTLDINRKIERGNDLDVMTYTDPWYSLATVIKHGADPDLQNYGGQTPIHILVSNLPEASLSMTYAIIFEPKLNQTMLVQLYILLKLNADADCIDNEGRTAIDICQQQKNWCGVKLLNRYTNNTRVCLLLEDVDYVKNVAKQFGTKYLQKAVDLERHLEAMSDMIIEPQRQRSLIGKTSDAILEIWKYIDMHVNGN